MQISVSVLNRAYFSIQHIRSAAYFTRSSAALENAYEGKYSEDLIAQHRAYVTGAIFAAVAFLEATINELFKDTVENLHGTIKALERETIERMADMWKLQGERQKILDKFQIALTLIDRKAFAKGKEPYQSVQLVVELRNALVHYKPEWIDPEAVDAHKFERMLKSKKFPINPLVGPGNAFYPDKCLSHGCARWAVNSSIKFADEFFLRVGLRPTFDHVRSVLNTE